jgi:transposase
MLANYWIFVEKKSFYAKEQERADVIEKRENFIDSIVDIDPANIIVIDEAGADLGMVTNYSRAEGGNRAKAPKPFVAGEKFSIVGAISMIGIIAVMYVELAVNTDIFLCYIEQLLLPKLKPGQYVIMDNAKIHKSETIANLIESVGAKVVFLPPYSPDLSPIEKMWSKVKEILKRLMPRTKADFHKALGVALHSVNQEDCEEWFDSCGYPLQPI